MSERVVCLVQARQGSSRLPGKSLRALHGRPLIHHVLERALAIEGVDKVVLATSGHERDLPLALEAHRVGVDTYCGSEWDVLERMMMAARMHLADVVIRVTGDCPLLAPDVATRVLKFYFADPLGSRYVWNDTSRSGYPDGTDVEVFDATLLTEAHNKTWDRTDREHVTTYMRRAHTAAMVNAADDWARLKLSVDTLEDFERVGRILAHMETKDFTLAATIAAARKAGVA